MDYLKINFEEMRNGVMASTFDSLERAFDKFNIDFYLIGAFARDMWMNHLEELPSRRATRDIDFSLYIRDIEDFQKLKDYLEVNEGFVKGDEPYRLFSPDQTIVDLLPFGGIEDDGVVYLDGKKPIDISVFGNMQVLNNAAIISTENREFKICTLPGLCIMKLISASEKSDRLNKDMGDFYYILENYFEIAGEKIFESPYEDLIDDNFVPKIASAKMLGREIKVILSESDELRDKVLILLARQKGGFSDEEITNMYIQEKNDNQIIRMKLITQLLLEL
ncbi:nucleotidyl transferase AbiEii/AbiGii toxin family protein [Pedobacter nanyangensis]|uniref:nucleotidyl transferase AbiEii/AbiGii toxin family protein n=1 Tax=Pedobacter nanyangensis TaxID=1562389 RepID=UPI000DE4F9A7|nr:nucleotidyl transferase AbiEii/AbiGii toxin family protein [Pedobacter nanyangensis]